MGEKYGDVIFMSFIFLDPIKYSESIIRLLVKLR